MGSVFDVAAKKDKLKKLEEEMGTPDFWQEKERAAEASREASKIKEDLNLFEELEVELELLGEEKDAGKIEEFEKKLKEKELFIFLSGKYDSGNAILTIFAGAGGRDSQDWATMLLRMYERYCQRKGFKIRILDQSFGEAGGPEGRIGIKSAALEIKGEFAYGFLKRETGVHRLVRISPFSSKSLRHTSFCLVEVMPDIPKPKDIELQIRPEDLKTDFYKASGPGGQYVNKRMTAVRITHLPTGIVASCQVERSQAQNKERAMEMLYARLYRLLEETHEKEISKIKGERVSASWGNQIRSYVIHPYKMVKDLRTDEETSRPEEVLDGNLDQFIEAEIKSLQKND